MKRLALFAGLVAGLALAQVQGGIPLVAGIDLSQFVGTAAFFEFAGTNGAGMTASCACSAVSGAKGEAITFARSGTAICSKRGMATTGILDGDLVSCASGQPRIELDVDGVRGLRVEYTRTNSALRSQELDAAAVWLPLNSGMGNPVVTANAAIAPDGTMTADKVAFPAVSGAGSYSILRQYVANAARTMSCYAKSESGTASFYISDGDINATPTLCTVGSTSWTRCSAYNATGGLTTFELGTNLNVMAETAQSAATVYIWGCQWESSATFATSYIPTTTAAAVRNTESAYFTLPTPGPSANNLSLSAYVTKPWATTASSFPYFLMAGTVFGNAGKGMVLGSQAGSGPNVYCILSNDSGTASSTGTVVSTGAKAWCSATGAVASGFWGSNMTPTAPLAGTFSPVTFVSIGSNIGFQTVTYTDSIYSRVCLDPSPTRCR